MLLEALEVVLGSWGPWGQHFIKKTDPVCWSKTRLLNKTSSRYRIDIFIVFSDVSGFLHILVVETVALERVMPFCPVQFIIAYKCSVNLCSVNLSLFNIIEVFFTILKWRRIMISGSEGGAPPDSWLLLSTCLKCIVHVYTEAQKTRGKAKIVQNTEKHSFALKKQH